MKIVFTVTNDLNYDQRMQRICNSLANAGYSILLIGRKFNGDISLQQQLFNQKRIHCFFKKGFLFYAEYNARLFFFLLFVKIDAVCAIDLDTILPCYFVSIIRNKKRIYDAHELFTEMKEIITRPAIKKTWLGIEKFAVAKFINGYTVSYSIAEEFKKRYDVSYEVVRNIPVKGKEKIALQQPKNNNKIILYQGAVNEARGLENLIVAMQFVQAELHIYGDGNIYDKISQLITSNKLENKVFLKGKVLPAELKRITQQSYIGINLVEPIGLNQLYSLANKFFDYIQAGVPQVTMNFPEYKKINDEFKVAVLVDTVDAKEVAAAINNLLNDENLYKQLKQNCIEASSVFTWQNEEKKLINFYKNIFSN